jgi:hypothetical protein
MKNSQKLKFALLREFVQIENELGSQFADRHENDVDFGNEQHREHAQICPECYVPAMYEGVCDECGYMEEGSEDFNRGGLEGEMLKNSIHTIARVATHLDSIVSVEDQFPEWLIEKIGQAKDAVSSVMQYISSEEEMKRDGDFEEAGDGQEHNDDMELSSIMEAVRAKKKPSKGLTKKQKSSVEKKIRAGKKVGHGGFEKVAKKAEKEYGSKESGRRVAAAAMWKNVKRK